MLYRATSGTFGGVLFAFAFLLVGQPSPFSIVVERGSPENGLITGKLSVNGHRIGTTYENQALEIPAGTYAGVLRYVSGRNFVSGPLGTIGTQGDFLLEVSGVSGRTDILFHGGNKPAQSQGCIMLGPVVPPPGSSIPSLADEHPLRKLRLLFYGKDIPDSTPNKAITVQIAESEEVSRNTHDPVSATVDSSKLVTATGILAAAGEVFTITARMPFNTHSSRPGSVQRILSVVPATKL